MFIYMRASHGCSARARAGRAGKNLSQQARVDNRRTALRSLTPDDSVDTLGEALRAQAANISEAARVKNARHGRVVTATQHTAAEQLVQLREAADRKQQEEEDKKKRVAQRKVAAADKAAQREAGAVEREAQKAAKAAEREAKKDAAARKKANKAAADAQKQRDKSNAAAARRRKLTQRPLEAPQSPKLAAQKRGRAAELMPPVGKAAAGAPQVSLILRQYALSYKLHLSWLLHVGSQKVIVCISDFVGGAGTPRPCAACGGSSCPCGVAARCGRGAVGAGRSRAVQPGRY